MSDLESIYKPKGRTPDSKQSRPTTINLSDPKHNFSTYKKDYLMEGRIDSNGQPNSLPVSSASSTSSVPLSAQHLKISIRLPKGIVTSLTIKKNIIALWLLYTYDVSYIDLDSYFANDTTCPKEQKKLKDKISKMVTDFVYKCLDKWKKESGKGLSDFITEMMIEDFLEDYNDYEELLPLI